MEVVSGEIMAHIWLWLVCLLITMLWSAEEERCAVAKTEEEEVRDSELIYGSLATTSLRRSARMHTDRLEVGDAALKLTVIRYDHPSFVQTC